VEALRQSHPDVALGINASAPTIHNDHPRSHIDELAGLFDEYVTEWNPLRWGQPPSIVGGAIDYASEHGRVLHATTATMKGVVHRGLGDLLREIVAHGATPRLGIDPRRHPELGEALDTCR
jgi:hypothetical protein